MGAMFSHNVALKHETCVIICGKRGENGLQNEHTVQTRWYLYPKTGAGLIRNRPPTSLFLPSLLLFTPPLLLYITSPSTGNEMPQLEVLTDVVFFLWAFISCIGFLSLSFSICMYDVIFFFSLHGPEEQNRFGHTHRQNIQTYWLYFAMQCYAIGGSCWVTRAVMCGCLLPLCGL